MKTNSQAGSHIVALALLVVVIGVIGFVGYTVWQNQMAAPTASTTSASVPAKITNKATLNQAATVLDQSSAQLNASLDSATLNGYLKKLL